MENQSNKNDKLIKSDTITVYTSKTEVICNDCDKKVHKFTTLFNTESNKDVYICIPCFKFNLQYNNFL